MALFQTESIMKYEAKIVKKRKRKKRRIFRLEWIGIGEGHVMHDKKQIEKRNSYYFLYFCS